MNALEKRIAELERRFMPPEPLVIRVVYTEVDRYGVERVIGDSCTGEPDLHVRFVAAPDLEESYPQAVDKSAPPSIIIELDAGDDIDDVARELGISADDLNRQINSGAVKLVSPMPDIPIYQPKLTAKIDWC